MGTGTTEKVTERTAATGERVRRAISGLAVGCLLLIGTGCATQTPSIAHVHVGHAITAAHDTPDRVGYLVLAETRANQALEAAESAVAAQTVAERRDAILEVDEITSQREDYSLVEAVREAVGHIEFAADSDDASENIRALSRSLGGEIEGVVSRSDLVHLYAIDAARSDSAEELEALAIEVRRLASANLNGDPQAPSGQTSGVLDLRRQIDEATDRENPPYTTVDRWYLFNLIRLPSGDWAFRRDGSSGGTTY